MVTSTGPGRLEYYSRLVSCQVEICMEISTAGFTASSPSSHPQCIEGKARFRQSARVLVRNRCRSKPALPCSPARTLRELLCGGCARDSWAENFWRAQGCSAVRWNPANLYKPCSATYKFAPVLERPVLRKKIKPKGMTCVNSRCRVELGPTASSAAIDKISLIY